MAWASTAIPNKLHRNVVEKRFSKPIVFTPHGARVGELDLALINIWLEQFDPCNLLDGVAQHFVNIPSQLRNAFQNLLLTFALVLGYSSVPTKPREFWSQWDIVPFAGRTLEEDSADFIRQQFLLDLSGLVVGKSSGWRITS